ncbi:hypothetical protein ACFQX7_18285 [Luedemannella flava]
MPDRVLREVLEGLAAGEDVVLAEEEPGEVVGVVGGQVHLSQCGRVAGHRDRPCG